MKKETTHKIQEILLVANKTVIKEKQNSNSKFFAIGKESSTKSMSTRQTISIILVCRLIDKRNTRNRVL